MNKGTPTDFLGKPVLDGEIADLLSKWAEHGKIAMPRSPIESITAGMQLEMVKASTPHGMFFDRVNALGFKKSTARKYMACSRLFDPHRDATVLAAAGTAVKLTELLCLNAEEVMRLGRGDHVRGLTLGSLSGMTALQLRKALGRSAPREGVKLSAEEERMLRNYRKCKPDAKAHVARAAELLAAPT